MPKPSVDGIISNWMDQPRRLARQLIDKYGEPDEVSANMMIWYNNGPWKKTILRNEELPHQMPTPHKDSLENVIDYHVPPEKADDLEMYDGSILFDRTKGEMSARCEHEAMNTLALNLANDIVTGKATVEQARHEYGNQAMAFMQKQPAFYTEGLQFEVPKGGTADPDTPVMKAA
ncbi:MAG TPA: hypothetical protein VE439_02250 [Anaerolineae bacterium]|nr:hypothetical protein [Anaerolineae bacterium]